MDTEPHNANVFFHHFSSWLNCTREVNNTPRTDLLDLVLGKPNLLAVYIIEGSSVERNCGSEVCGRLRERHAPALRQADKRKWSLIRRGPPQRILEYKNDGLVGEKYSVLSIYYCGMKRYLCSREDILHRQRVYLLWEKASRMSTDHLRAPLTDGLPHFIYSISDKPLVMFRRCHKAHWFFSFGA